MQTGWIIESQLPGYLGNSVHVSKRGPRIDKEGGASQGRFMQERGIISPPETLFKESYTKFSLLDFRKNIFCLAKKIK